MKKIALSLVLVFVLAVTIILFTSQKTEAEIVQTTPYEVVVEYQPIYRPCAEEGIDNIRVWWETLLGKRAEFDGLTESYIEEYQDFLSDEDINNLWSCENNIIQARCITKVQENEEQYLNIIDNADAAKVKFEEEEAARIAAEKVAKAAQVYIPDNPTPTYSGGSYNYSGSGLTPSAGVYYGPSGKETYYNLDMSGVVNNACNMGIEGEYWVRDDGAKMYGDYIIVAANLDTHPRGSIVETSLGMGIVLDTGGFAASNPNQIDVATAW